MIAKPYFENDDCKKTHEIKSIGNAQFTNLLALVLKTGSSFAFCAAGNSMHPLIKNGDIITVASLGGNSPRLGEVMAFVQPGSNRLIVHRVVECKKNRFILKGDNRESSDGIISRQDILGVVRQVERNGKKVCLGLGLERILVAMLTRQNRLFQILFPLWRCLRPLARRFKWP